MPEESGLSLWLIRHRGFRRWMFPFTALLCLAVGFLLSMEHHVPDAHSRPTVHAVVAAAGTATPVMPDRGAVDRVHFTNPQLTQIAQELQQENSGWSK